MKKVLISLSAILVVSAFASAGTPTVVKTTSTAKPSVITTILDGNKYKHKNPVPEPFSLMALGIGAAMVARRKKSQ
jgi:hypothetical protein